MKYENLLVCKEPDISNTPKLELGMCMIIGKYDIYRIPEVIAYHNLIGVGKFFIYYNFKEDELKENYRHFFEPFVKSGLVVLVPFDLNTKKYIEPIKIVFIKLKELSNGWPFRMPMNFSY